MADLCTAKGLADGIELMIRQGLVVNVYGLPFLKKPP